MAICFSRLVALFLLSQFYFCSLYAKSGKDVLSLPNGMKVFFVNDDSIPFVAAAISIGSGSYNDPIGKAGMAHFAEHVIAGGMTSDVNGKPLPGVIGSNCDASSLFGSNGLVRSNAFTSFSMTSYYGVTEIGYEQNLIDQLYRIVATPLFVDEKEMNAERNVVISEISLRGNALNDLYEDLLTLDGFKESFSRVVIGYEDQINSITASDMNDFLSAEYVPSNANIIVYGNIDAEKIKNHIMKNWDFSRSLEKPKASRLEYISGSKCDCKKKIIKKQKNVGGDFFLFSIPINTLDFNIESLAKAFLTNRMFGSLCKNAFSDTSYADSVFSDRLSSIGLKSCSFDYGVTHISGFVFMRNNASFADVENLFEIFFDDLGKGKITESELKSLKFSVESSRMRALDGFMNSFIQYVYYLPLINDVVDFDRLRSSINNVSSKDLSDFFLNRISSLYDPVFGLLHSEENSID